MYIPITYFAYWGQHVALTEVTNDAERVYSRMANIFLVKQTENRESLTSCFTTTNVKT